MLRSVAVIALPRIAPFELGVVCELFGVDRTDTGGPRFDFTVCAREPGALPTTMGYEVLVHHGLQATATADLVIVPAYTGDGRLHPEVTEALQDAHRRGAWVMSVCSGAFALGEAGLLDGRRCTTHWMHADELAQRFPQADVDPAVLYVEDDRVLTSAGSAAGIDAGLHLIRCELGATTAATVARRMVVPPQRDGGQAQYIDRPVRTVTADSLAGLLDWMAAHLDQDQSVESLAQRAHMSPRTFARRFRAETGTTPAAWLNQQRLQAAREMLENTRLSIDSIATRVGFGAGAALRHHFTRAVGTTPQAYRRTFSCVPDLPTAIDAAG